MYPVSSLGPRYALLASREPRDRGYLRHRIAQSLTVSGFTSLVRQSLSDKQAMLLDLGDNHDIKLTYSLTLSSLTSLVWHSSWSKWAVF